MIDKMGSTAYPAPRRHGQVGRPTKLTDGLKALVVEHVRKFGYNLAAMAKVADVTSRTLGRHLVDDKAFREAIEDARGVFVALLEDEARRRAVEGYKEKRYSPAGQSYDVPHYSDALLVKLMKANDPNKYGDSVRVEKTVTVRQEIGFRRLSLAGQKRLLELLQGENATDAEFRLLEGGDQGDEAAQGQDEQGNPAERSTEHPSDDPQDHGTEEQITRGSHVPPLLSGGAEVVDESADQEDGAADQELKHGGVYHASAPEDEPDPLDEDPDSL